MIIKFESYVQRDKKIRSNPYELIIMSVISECKMSVQAQTTIYPSGASMAVTGVAISNSGAPAAMSSSGGGVSTSLANNVMMAAPGQFTSESQVLDKHRYTAFTKSQYITNKFSPSYAIHIPILKL